MAAYNNDEIASILERYGDMAYRMAFIQMKSRDAADDIYQEACMRLLRLEHRLDGGEHIKAWLLRTTLHCCRDFWKSAWHRNVTPAGHCGGKASDGCPQEPCGWVTQCVQELPEKYRAAVHLYYYEGYSLKEIARILEIKESTAASRLSRGRGRLKKMLEKGKTAYGTYKSAPEKMEGSIHENERKLFSRC